MSLEEQFSQAAFNGRNELVELLYQKGATGLDFALIEATRGGAFPTIKLLVNLGATDFEGALRVAPDLFAIQRYLKIQSMKPVKA